MLQSGACVRLVARTHHFLLGHVGPMFCQHHFSHRRTTPTVHPSSILNTLVRLNLFHIFVSRIFMHLFMQNLCPEKDHFGRSTSGISWLLLILLYTQKSTMYTLWLFNIAMENGPFIDGLPIKNGDFPWLC